MKRSILIILFLIVEFTLNSQNKRIDSLLQRLEYSEKKESIDGLNMLSGEFIKINIDSALLFADKALEFSQKVNYKKGKMLALKNGATISSLFGVTDSADVLFAKSRQLAIELNDKFVEAACWVGIANNSYLNGNITVYLNNTRIAKSIFEKAGIERGIAATCNSIGDYYADVSNYDSALFYFNMSYDIKKRIKDSAGIISTLNSIGFIHSTKGKYVNSVDCYIQALKIAESKKEKLWIIRTLNNLSSVFFIQKNYNNALKYSERALKLALEMKNPSVTTGILNSIGNIYLDCEKIASADSSFSSAYTLSIKNQLTQSTQDALIGKGRVKIYQAEYDNAIQFLKEAIEICIRQRDYSMFCFASGLLGNCYDKLGKLKDSYLAYRAAKDTAVLIDSKPDLMNASAGLAKIYASMNDFKNAYAEQLFYSDLKDSILNAENFKQINELQALFENEKKEKDLVIKNNEIVKKDAVILKQTSQRNYLIIILAVIGVIALLIFIGYRNIRKANFIISEQKNEVEKQKAIIEQQKHLVEEKQHEIIDSINYAKRLQEAILPPQSLVDKYLKDNFILYKPKDIVAGDFYWFEHLDNCSYMAAADSTGHGVPGAMVSVVCSNALNRAVHEFGLRKPGEILDKTRELVLETFAKSDKDVKDGMDISLVKISEMEPSKNIPGRIVIPKGQTLKDVITSQAKFKIEWAGANNPLWYYQNNVMQEVTAHKQSIGKTENPTAFPTTVLELCKGDQIYLFTDGFADQFGGPKGKKFKYKQLQELLASICSEDLTVQKIKTEQAFQKWKGNLEQIDDVCLIGIRV